MIDGSQAVPLAPAPVSLTPPAPLKLLTHFNNIILARYERLFTLGSSGSKYEFEWKRRHVLRSLTYRSRNFILFPFVGEVGRVMLLIVQRFSASFRHYLQTLGTVSAAAPGGNVRGCVGAEGRSS